MSIQLICDQCNTACGPGESAVEIRHVFIRPGINQVESDDYPSVMHWRCIVPFVQRRDAEDKEPPF